MKELKTMQVKLNKRTMNVNDDRSYMDMTLREVFYLKLGERKGTISKTYKNG